MRILIDGTVRDMTPEEEAQFRSLHDNLPQLGTEDALVRCANELTGGTDETLEEAAETLIKKFKEENEYAAVSHH